MVKLNDIRGALLALVATGSSGFEGLVGAVLEQIAGRPFRLAKSGLQAGRDGDDALEGQAHISYECKLYTSSLSSADVQAKITQLIASANIPDVWVLGATVEVGSQLASVLQKAALRSGLGIQILDWPATSEYPPLAVALAMASERTAEFLAANIDDPELVERAKAALCDLAAKADFQLHASAVSAELRAASLGMANAIAANGDWLAGVFGDRGKSLAALGQVIAPLATLALPQKSRLSLTEAAKSHLMAQPSRSLLAVAGGEGNGKSWLVAETWLSLEERPLLVVVPAADMKVAAAYGEFADFLVGHVLRQTSEEDNERSRLRWQRRFKAWTDDASPERPRFILWIDGLNEQPTFQWRRWLEDAASNVEALGGSLVVTVRRGFFQERLQRSLNAPIHVVTVPEWTLEELDELLRSLDVKPDQVAPKVRERLRNPRILGIASRLLSSSQIQNFTELTVERLLFEHIRASDVDMTTSEPSQFFERRLAEHANEIMARAASQQRDSRLVFDQMATEKHILSHEKLASTAEHFFRPLPEDPTLYSLPEEALGLALGLAILQTLRSAERSGRDVEGALTELLEPIAALDMTADAVFAALVLSSFDERISDNAKAALYVGFASLQNIDAEYYEPFVATVRSATEAALHANEQLLLRDRTFPNHFWLTRALREVRGDAIALTAIEAYVRRWLRTYSLDPRVAEFVNSRDIGGDAYATRLAERQNKLDDRIAGLTAEERTFLDDHLVRDDMVDPAALHKEALELLPGLPLAPFAQDIIACAFGLAVNASLHDAYDELLGLVRFNRVDWEETRDALLRDSAFLARPDASTTGRWAYVQLLRAISREEDGWEANRLVEQLVADRPLRQSWRRVENYSAGDPCDPASLESDNVAEAAAMYAEINVGALTTSRSMGFDDHTFKDARPAIARFYPEVAADKLREYAKSGLSREPKLRQLSVCSLEQHSAAMDDVVVAEMLATAAELSEPRRAQGRSSEASVDHRTVRDPNQLPTSDGRRAAQLPYQVTASRSPAREIC